MTVAVRHGGWLALSDHPGPVAAILPDLVQQGTLVLELGPPRPGASVLLDYRNDAGWPRALSIFHDPAVGIVLRHRQGDTLCRHHLPGPLTEGWANARLTYHWDGPARRWHLRLEDIHGAWAHQAEGGNPMPIAGADCLALCSGPQAARRDPAVDWFGFTHAAPGLPVHSWVGQRTPIDTPTGVKPAEMLRPGDLVCTLDNGPKPIRSLHRMMLPNRGRFAPVLLRAPYFARHTDLLVASGQLMLLSGSAVEYLFGEDAVLAPAAALRDGNCALSDHRRPITACIALDLGAPELIQADGCPLLTGADSPVALPRRLLHDYEVLPLQSFLGRGGLRNVA